MEKVASECHIRFGVSHVTEDGRHDVDLLGYGVPDSGQAVVGLIKYHRHGIQTPCGVSLRKVDIG